MELKVENFRIVNWEIVIVMIILDGIESLGHLRVFPRPPFGIILDGIERKSLTKQLEFIKIKIILDGIESPRHRFRSQ